MNKFSKPVIFVVIMASLVLSACLPESAPPTVTLPAVAAATSSPASANATVVAVNTVAPLDSPTSVPTNPPAVVVVTATGVSDLGQLLGDQPMTPVTGDLIDWDHLRLYTGWEKGKGLIGTEVLYFQTGVPNAAPIPQLKETDEVFVVPTGTVLIFGAYSATVTFGDGVTHSRTEGFYNAFEAGTSIKELFLTDGFALLIKAVDAKREYCARVSQAMSETPPWAHKNLYVPASWPEEFCEGAITTPQDSDR